MRSSVLVLQSYRGTSLIRNRLPPKDHLRALGIFLLKGPTGALFLLSEVPLYILWTFSPLVEIVLILIFDKFDMAAVLHN